MTARGWPSKGPMTALLAVDDEQVVFQMICVSTHRRVSSAGRARSTSSSRRDSSSPARRHWRSTAPGAACRPRWWTSRTSWDEFNHGVASPWAVRDFLAWAHRKWRPRPRFVVLAGSGSLDPRDNLGHGGNLLTPVLVTTPYGLAASDQALVELAGDDGVPEVAAEDVLAPEDLPLRDEHGGGARGARPRLEQRRRPRW